MSTPIVPSSINIPFNTTFATSINDRYNPFTFSNWIEKNLILPSTTISNVGQIFYIKTDTNDGTFQDYTSSYAVFKGTPSTTIETFSSIRFSSLQAYTVQYQSTTKWSILNKFEDITQFSYRFPFTQPSTKIVNVQLDSSMLFVDSRTESKTLVLPAINTISGSSSNSLFLTIKDAYGNASTSTIFVSSAGAYSIDGVSSIALFSNFASIDLVANPVRSRWSLVNYYGGSLVNQ